MKLFGKSKRLEHPPSSRHYPPPPADPRFYHDQRRRQEHRITSTQPNQYEYVRREHGFDFMPPSQYVPSRSMSVESDEVGIDPPPIQINQLPASDLSGPSIDVEYEKTRSIGRRTPVVRGKPVKSKSCSREKLRYRRGEYPQHVDQASDEELSRPSHVGKMNEDRSRRRSPRMPPAPFERPSTDAYYDNVKPYRRNETRKDQRERHGYKSDSPIPVVKIPTAYDYNSDDSRENYETREDSRYCFDVEEHLYRKRAQDLQSPQTPQQRVLTLHRYGWTKSPKIENMSDFTTPAFQHRPPQNAEERIEKSPRENQRLERFPPPGYGRNFETAEAREPPEPYLEIREMDTGFRRRSGYKQEIPPEVYANTIPYDDCMEYDERNRRESNVKQKGKKKTKGIFGRLLNTVRGERDSSLHGGWGLAPQMNTGLRSPATLRPQPFERAITHSGEEYPNGAAIRPAYMYEDDSCDQADIRRSSKPDPPHLLVQPPRVHPRLDAHYDERYIHPPPDYMHGYSKEKYSRPSKIPFRRVGKTVPPLRQRPAKLAQHHQHDINYYNRGDGHAIPPPARRPPHDRLQFDATKAKQRHGRQPLFGYY